MCVNGRAGESGEELEEPGYELSSQLLGLNAGLGRVNDSLVVLHILQTTEKARRVSYLTGSPGRSRFWETLETQKKRGEWELRKRT